MGSVQLKRVGGVARAANILVGLAAALVALAWLAGRSVTDEAEAFLAGETSSDDFIEAAAPFALLSFLQLVTFIAAIVLVMIWMYRVASNHRTLHRVGTWGPGWAIGGWFLPPLLYIIPFLMFRELWKASDPTVPVGGDWKSRPVSPLVTAWFVVYSVILLAVNLSEAEDAFGGLGGSEEGLAEQLTASQGTAVASTVLTLVSAALFIAMNRGLTARHRQLTGEARP